MHGVSMECGAPPEDMPASPGPIIRLLGYVRSLIGMQFTNNAELHKIREALKSERHHDSHRGPSDYDRLPDVMENLTRAILNLRPTRHASINGDGNGGGDGISKWQFVLAVVSLIVVVVGAALGAAWALSTQMNKQFYDQGLKIQAATTAIEDIRQHQRDTDARITRLEQQNERAR